VTDPREQLRRYLEQRRELGERELVLDDLSVDEVLRIVAGPHRRSATTPKAVAAETAARTPPVTETPAIMTETPGTIEMTGPPPLIVVLAAPAPSRLMLFVTVKPPSYVPAAIWIVSPLVAAASAGPI